MQYKICWLVFSFLIFCSIKQQAQDQTQDQGRFSGDINLNANFYERDSLINAAGTSFYDNLKSGAESWLSLNYSKSGFDLGVRFDLYNNSNRIFPTQDYTEQGIGAWFIRKKIDKLTLTGGYFYDQFGSGSTFRAFEQRLLGIDKAILGIKAEYELTDFINIKAFTGRQKFLFDLNASILKGANIESYHTFNEGKITLIPGISVVNRTLDEGSILTIANGINLLELDDRFVPKYNSYTGSIYNTLIIGKFDWFFEYAQKTNEAVNTIGNFWEDLNGNFLYSTLSYSQKGLGLTLQAKRVENFRLRTDPLERTLQNNVLFNFLPATNREHASPLLARYNAQALELDEMAVTFDAVYTPKKGLTFQGSFSNITDLTGDSLLYREYFVEVEIKKRKAPWKLHTGLQVLDYNIAVYQQKGTYLNSMTPFLEFIYKFNKKTSLRFETEYLISQRNTRFSEGFDAKIYKQDRNDWWSGLLELTISPHWSFALNDMYNINPENIDEKQHFYGAFVGYTAKTNRLGLFYGKRVDGIVCSGGVCRFEPAFSGVQFQLSSSF